MPLLLPGYFLDFPSTLTDCERLRKRSMTLETAPVRLSEPDRGRRNGASGSTGLRGDSGDMGAETPPPAAPLGGVSALREPGNQLWPRSADMRLLGLRLPEEEEPLESDLERGRKASNSTALREGDTPPSTSSPDCLRALDESCRAGRRWAPPDSERRRSEGSVAETPSGGPDG